MYRGKLVLPSLSYFLRKDPGYSKGRARSRTTVGDRSPMSWGGLCTVVNLRLGVPVPNINLREGGRQWNSCGMWNPGWGRSSPGPTGVWEYGYIFPYCHCAYKSQQRATCSLSRSVPTKKRTVRESQRARCFPPRPRSMLTNQVNTQHLC